MAAAQAAAAGGAGAQVDAENAEQLLAERAAELRRAQQRERERRARRRARRPPHINGLLTTAEGRLLVATNVRLHSACGLVYLLGTCALLSLHAACQRHLSCVPSKVHLAQYPTSPASPSH